MAEENQAAEETSTEAEAPASGGSNKVLLIISTVQLIAVLGIAGVIGTSFKKKQVPEVGDMSLESKDGSAEDAAEGEAEGEGAAPAKKQFKNVREFGVMIDLEQLTINLSNTGSMNPKFARVNMSLEVPNIDVEAEVTRRMPEVRNTIIDLFNAKRPKDLASPEGKNYLKEEIRNALNSFLITGKISGVFFTNFAISG